MITILLFLISIVICFKILRSNNDDASEKVWACIFALMIMIMGGTLICCAGSVLWKKQEVARINHNERIYSLRNDESITGSFFLGSGSIDGQEYYYTFVQDSRGGFYREKYRASDCYIFQDTNTNAYKHWQTIVSRPSKWVHIWPRVTWKEATRIDLHVSKNTIIEEFKVN